MNPCKKLTYKALLKMKQTADFHHDAYWELGLYDVAIRYTRISTRILKAMIAMPIENVLKG